MSTKRILLLAKMDNFDCLPDDLKKVFSKLQGIEFDLQTGGPLIGGDPAVIVHNLGTKGWHLWLEVA